VASLQCFLKKNNNSLLPLIICYICYLKEKDQNMTETFDAHAVLLCRLMGYHSTKPSSESLLPCSVF
jgi:hypothetical protein